MHGKLKHLTLLAAAGSGLVLLGCEDYNNPPTGATTPSAVETHTDTATDFSDAANEQLDTARGEIADNAERVADQTGVIAQNARPLLDGALADIDAGRYDQAQAKLDQLDDMELPAAFDQQVADARRVLDAQRDVKPAPQGADSNGAMSY